MNKVLNIMVEPTSACNFDCEYCYKGPKDSRSLSIESFNNLIGQVANLSNANSISCELIWHGGEPTLMGVDFYKKAFSTIRSHHFNIPLTQSMQTNGLLLTSEFARLFIDNNVRIGISLDSISSNYHDKTRVALNSNNNKDLVKLNALNAKKEGGKVNILMSITQGNIREIDEMFDFCYSNNLDLGVSPISADFYAKHSNLQLSTKDILQAFISLYDKWFYQNDYRIRVNPAFGITNRLLSNETANNFPISCQDRYISLGPDEYFYPCNRFYGQIEYRFAHINEGIEKALSSITRSSLLKRSYQTIIRCKKCNFAQYCQSGCMHQALVHYGKLDSPDYLCSVYKGLMIHAIKRIKESISKTSALSHQP